MHKRKSFRMLLAWLLVLTMTLSTGVASAFSDNLTYGEGNAYDVVAKPDYDDVYETLPEIPDYDYDYEYKPEDDYYYEEEEPIAFAPMMQGGTEMEILNVEVLFGGQYQAWWRIGDDHPDYDFNFTRYTVYAYADAHLFDGSEEVPGRFYTTSRIASMTDPRLFTVRFTIPAGNFTGVGTGATEFNPANISWTYGGRALNTWVSHLPATGDLEGDRIRIMGTPEAVLAGDMITVTAQIRFGSFVNALGTGTVALLNRPWGTNIPYFSINNPTMALINLVGNHRLVAYYNATELACREIRLSINDSFQTWGELDSFIRNHPANIINNPGGLDNFGYHDRFLKFESFGQSHQGREMWAAVISDSADTVNRYLTETRPLMNTDPALLQSQLDTGPGGDQHRGVLFFTMNHGNELPGPPKSYELIRRLIEEESLVFTRAIDYGRQLPQQFVYSTAMAGYRYRIGISYEVVDICIDTLLQRYIIVLGFWTNPDGYANMWRSTAFNFDLNRDAIFASQIETRHIQRALARWDPIYMLEFHGYFRNFLMDGTTPPYAPYFEPDLIEANMLGLIDSIGMSVIGRSAMNLYNVPTRDAGAGWDNGSAIYTPSMSMLFGALGSTIEIPDNTQDAFDAQMQGVYGLFRHVSDDAVWKSLLYNKAEFKRRGVENLDLRNVVDQYFTSIHPLIEEIRNHPTVVAWAEPMPANIEVGRPRKPDGADGELSFFPDYYIIPVDKALQRSPGAAFETLYLLQNAGVRLDRTIQEVTHDGVTYPEGTFIINMRQAARTFAQAVLHDGYDASIYESMYDQVVMSFPHLRGFESIAVYTSNVFTGHTRVALPAEVDRITPRVNIVGEGDFVIIRNDSPDAIKMANRILRAGHEVRMMTGYVLNGVPGDFVVQRSHAMAAANDLVNPVFGPLALTLNGVGFGSAPPVNSELIVAPNVGYWGWSTAWSDVVRYFLYLYEFEYHGRVQAAWAARPASNVYLIVGSAPWYDLADDIMSGTPAVLVSGAINMSYLGPAAADRIVHRYTPAEALMRADFAANIILANMTEQSTVYVLHTGGDSQLIQSLPNWMEPLVVVQDTDDFFIAGRDVAGWSGTVSDFRGTPVVATGVYTTAADVDVAITAISANIFERGGMHLYYRMVANALFAKASEIDVVGEPGLDFTGLQTAIAAANALTEAHWTVASWNAMQTALAAAQAAMIATTQEQIDIAATDLNDAIGALVRRPTAGPGTGGVTQPPVIPEDDDDEEVEDPEVPLAPGDDYRFRDVNSGHWFYGAVNYVYENAIMHGVSADLFAPNASFNRAMAATVLFRMAGAEASFVQVFDDVAAGQWYSEAITWAAQNGIVLGIGNNLFDPYANVTREQLAAMFFRYATFMEFDMSTSELTGFVDVADVSYWALEAMSWAVHHEIIQGMTGNRLNPRGTATRAECATIIMRMMETFN